MDMLVNLYQLPEKRTADNYTIRRVLPPDIHRVCGMVKEVFGEGWASEILPALYRQPSSCYIAEHAGRVVGFACFDATALGYFGPIGLREENRGGGLGGALLVETLYGMREAGYGYGIIGWCDDAADFYRKAVGAKPIDHSMPEDTVYQRLLMFP